MKKKSIGLLILLCVCLLLSSCEYKSEQIEDYGEFKNSKYRILSEFDLFPDEIASTWIVEGYTFWYNETLLYDDVIVFLNLSFSDQDYESELSRIKNETYTYGNGGNAVLDEKNFNYTAYVFTYATKKYEYVLTIPEENRIVYIYLQTAPQKKCSFLEDYLPKEYFVAYQDDICYNA